jgi:hypothetical protein
MNGQGLGKDLYRDVEEKMHPMLLTKERIETIRMMGRSLLAFYRPTGEVFLLSLMIPNFMRLDRYVLMY